MRYRIHENEGLFFIRDVLTGKLVKGANFLVRSFTRRVVAGRALTLLNEAYDGQRTTQERAAEDGPQA